MASLCASIVADTGATTAIVVAVVAAGSSFVVAVMSQLLARRTNKSLALLTSKLEEEAKTRNARIDYEYEAKKRVYQECEPLLFQTIELVETARARIKSLARTAKSNYIRPDGSGWLADSGYYFRSTAFYLLAPMTSFKILQWRLTAIDLSLEPRIREQYEMLKLLFYSFASDFELAGSKPTLSYHPDKADPGEEERERLLREQPAVYARQGLYRGTLDVVVEALLHSDDELSKDSRPGGVERSKTIGEFETEFKEPGSEIDAIRPYLDELFAGFHPQTKPVLWRVLLSQALLYDEFLEPHGAARSAAKDFEWRSVDDEPAPGDDAVGEDHVEHITIAMRAASDYVDTHLARVRQLVEPSP